MAVICLHVPIHKPHRSASDPISDGLHSSLEHTAAKLLKHMITERRFGPFSIHRLMRFERGRWQRRDRVRLILKRYLELGLIEVVLGNPPRYQVTRVGVRELPRIDEFLGFCEYIRFGKERRSASDQLSRDKNSRF